MAAFNVGDVVELKSGGPAMTVAEIGVNTVKCTWFSGVEAKEGSFPAAALEPYRAPQAHVIGGDYDPLDV